MAEINWQCLESNPESLDDYIDKLGFDTTQFCFNDLFSTEQWAQDSISKPVLGILLVFPCNQSAYDFKKQQYEELVKSGYKIEDQELFFLKQVALNSCGTVAIYHILTNLQGEYKKLLKDDSLVNKFKKDNFGKSVEQRSQAFNESKEIKESHVQAAQEGATTDIIENTNHFISFIHFNGLLYEMDGAKEFPIIHRKTSRDTFLADACEEIQKFMVRDPENVNFSLICLSKKSE